MAHFKRAHLKGHLSVKEGLGQGNELHKGVGRVCLDKDLVVPKNIFEEFFKKRPLHLVKKVVCDIVHGQKTKTRLRPFFHLLAIGLVKLQRVLSRGHRRGENITKTARKLIVVTPRVTGKVQGLVSHAKPQRNGAEVRLDSLEFIHIVGHAPNPQKLQVELPKALGPKGVKGDPGVVDQKNGAVLLEKKDSHEKGKGVLSP